MLHIKKEGAALHSPGIASLRSAFPWGSASHKKRKSVCAANFFTSPLPLPSELGRGGEIKKPG
ncbi:MAG: hypothetical protein CVU12_08205 [Bacteroidetes bacterium HGW-Bacteroidetes-7]|nr:MAG: hypothetical protein CVU12_08205 [Bacteroidetes bacterium HGW-Bacteroidetes-7]